MGRTRVRRRKAVTVAIVLGGLLVTGPMSRAFSPRTEPSPPGRVYVVRAGDTVWSIAERFADGADPRELVYAIGLRNGIDAGSIVPGQSLIIPARA